MGSSEDNGFSFTKKGFYEYIEQRFGSNEAIIADSIFFACGLVMPESGECIADEEGALAFLNDFGIVLRVSSRPDFPENDHVLKPLRSIPLGSSAVLEILPGIEGVCVKNDELNLLRHKLAEENCFFWDATPQNCGYARIPSDNLESQQKIPLVLDRGSVRQIRAGEEATVRAKLPDLKREWQEVSFAQLQDRFFQPAKNALEDAWPTDRELPDEDTMISFWRYCAGEIKKKRHGQPSVLSNGWCANEWSLASDEIRNNESAAKCAQASRLGHRYADRLCESQSPALQALQYD